MSLPDVATEIQQLDARVAQLESTVAQLEQLLRSLAIVTPIASQVELPSRPVHIASPRLRQRVQAGDFVMEVKTEE